MARPKKYACESRNFYLPVTVGERVEEVLDKGLLSPDHIVACIDPREVPKPNYDPDDETSVEQFLNDMGLELDGIDDHISSYDHKWSEILQIIINDWVTRQNNQDIYGSSDAAEEEVSRADLQRMKSDLKKFMSKEFSSLKVTLTERRRVTTEDERELKIESERRREIEGQFPLLS